MSRGHDRERKVRVNLELDGWVTLRAAGSLGPIDVVALKVGQSTRFIEVKSTAGGPYERFGPTSREILRTIAEQAGAEAWLCWWPPYKPPKWIPAAQWPPDARVKP